MSCKTAGHEFSHDFFSIENKDALFFQVLQEFHSPQQSEKQFLQDRVLA